jgi:alpha/beta superfamily hydrolase
MSFMIPAGPLELEAHLREPAKGLRGAAVFCHPHPVYGGSMDNRVVYRAAKAATEAGFAALRFNFRGVGRSSGQFDHGIGEKEDATSAIRWLEARYPTLDLALVGYSFGAGVGLEAAYSEPRILALVGLGIPLDLYDFGYLLSFPKPALYIVGTQDEFCARQSVDHFAHRLPSTSFLHRIEGSDHFFTGHMKVVEGLITDFFRKL